MVKRKSPIDFFFSLGDKATRGDPVKKAQFDYYLMWVIFFGFLLILYTNVKAFALTLDFKALGWTLVVLAILWFQYGSMKMARMAYQMMKKQKAGIDYNKVESVDEMMKLTKTKKEVEK